MSFIHTFKDTTLTLNKYNPNNKIFLQNLAEHLKANPGDEEKILKDLIKSLNEDIVYECAMPRGLKNNQKNKKLLDLLVKYLWQNGESGSENRFKNLELFLENKFIEESRKEITRLKFLINDFPSKILEIERLKKEKENLEMIKNLQIAKLRKEIKDLKEKNKVTIGPLPRDLEIERLNYKISDYEKILEEMFARLKK